MLSNRPLSIHHLSSDQSPFVWFGGTGDTVLRQDTHAHKSGKAKIIFCMHPAPEFRFEFVPHKTPDFLEAWFESGLSDATFDLRAKGSERWYVRLQTLEAKSPGILIRKKHKKKKKKKKKTNQIGESSAALKAVFIVINGPHVHGEPLNRGKHSYLGRLESTVDDHKIVIDALQSEPTPRSVVYEPTHVASCEFIEPANLESIEQVGSHLFRVLSLMKCRWVGLLGPWIYDSSGNLIEARLSVTKTMRNGGAISWYH